MIVMNPREKRKELKPNWPFVPNVGRMRIPKSCCFVIIFIVTRPATPTVVILLFAAFLHMGGCVLDAMSKSHQVRMRLKDTFLPALGEWVGEIYLM